MCSFGHGVRFQHGRLQLRLQLLENGGGERRGARADEADGRHGRGKGAAEENLVHGWDGGVPVCFECEEVAPEFRGGEAWWDDERATTEERGEETGEEAVDVEEWHDEEGAIFSREAIRRLDVLGCLDKIPVAQWDLFPVNTKSFAGREGYEQPSDDQSSRLCAE